ncbi:MAG TPA: hypothetical protein VI056_04090 [Candidatus Limnocylindria bacterium]
MKTRTTLLLTSVLLLSSTSANAREPLDDERHPIPAPPGPDPVAFVVPSGLYYVTDTYVADVVATSDATTVYSTTTVHESTGTYARVIDTVDTGASSPFDGMAFNGRGALTNGQALAGTYYENFVLTAGGYVPVSVVFFQDDSETKRLPGPSSSTAAPKASASPAPAATTAQRRDEIAPPPSTVRQLPIEPARLTLRAAISLAPDGPTLASAEVLRGRVVQFWPRVFANNVAVPIRSWRLLSAQPDHISASTGTTQPLVAQWIRMPAPNVTWSLRFEIFSESWPSERLEAEISVTLRSPALVD